MGITEPFFDKKISLSKATLRACKKAIQRVEDNSSGEDRIDTIKELLSYYEKGALAIRHELQVYDFGKDNSPDISSFDCVKDMPVEIIEKEDAIIIKTPVTIKRKNSDYVKGNSEIYFLAQYVHAAFKKWQKEEAITDQMLYRKFDKEKFDMVFIIMRKAASFNMNLHCDNDNMENSTIQNEICSALALGDCCLYMDLYSCFRLTDFKEDEGTEFIITGRKNLAKYTSK